MPLGDTDVHGNEEEPDGREAEQQLVAALLALANASQSFPSTAFALAVIRPKEDVDDDGSDAEVASWLIPEPDNSHEHSAAVPAASSCLGLPLLTLPLLRPTWIEADWLPSWL